MQMSILDAVVALRMAASKSEARRLIEQGGVKLNDQPVQSVTAAISSADLDKRGTARLIGDEAPRVDQTRVEGARSPFP